FRIHRGQSRICVGLKVGPGRVASVHQILLLLRQGQPNDPRQDVTRIEVALRPCSEHPIERWAIERIEAISIIRDPEGLVALLLKPTTIAGVRYPTTTFGTLARTCLCQGSIKPLRTQSGSIEIPTDKVDGVRESAFAPRRVRDIEAVGV